MTCHTLSMARVNQHRNQRDGNTSKWIQGAISSPGQLHRDLGVPQGEKIPAKKLAAAARKP